MSVKVPATVSEEIDYPTGDGKPVAETPIHRDNLLYSVWTLQQWYEADPNVYVSGNDFIYYVRYYVRGDKRKHVSPDVYVVKGVPKRMRDCFFLWEESKGPDVTIEMTSPSTRSEDLKKKFALYQDVLRVQEYYLFDPKAQYLKPPLKGFRLVDGKYVPIDPIDGRLPSEILGLHLERNETELRFYNPANATWLIRPDELKPNLEQAQAALQQAEAELEKVRRELDTLRQQRPDAS